VVVVAAAAAARSRKNNRPKQEERESRVGIPREPIAPVSSCVGYELLHAVMFGAESDPRLEQWMQIDSIDSTLRPVARFEKNAAAIGFICLDRRHHRPQSHISIRFKQPVCCCEWQSHHYSFSCR
jgi:hypothetical protein